VLADGPVKELADLKGRKIGFSVGGFETALLTTMLSGAGVTPGDVTLVNVNFALAPALLSGQVDAVIGGFRNFELNQLAIAGRPGRAFFPEEHGVPVYDELILVARQQSVRDPRLRLLVDGLERAVLYIVNHPDDAWAAFVAAHPDLNDELNRRAWQDTLTRFALRPAALDRTRYRRFAAFAHAQGLIDTVPPLDSYAVVLE